MKVWYYISILFVFQCCKKHEENDVVKNINTEFNSNIESVIILNEGTWQHNNASLTFYNTSSEVLHTNYFNEITNRNLGDVANDMIYAKPNLFIAVNGSNTLEKLNLNTKKSTQLPIVHFQSKKGRSPRQLSLNNSSGNLFLSNFDGTVNEVDTASVVIKSTMRVGKNPEGLSVFQNKLFVSNSGGLDFPNYDSTVSVIQFDPIVSLDTITVGLNPSTIIKSNDGMLYIQCNGDYDKTPSEVSVLNPITHTIENKLALNFQIHHQINDSLFFYDKTSKEIHLFDLRSQSTLKDFSFDVSFIETLTAISIEPKSKTIFVAEGYNYVSRGKVYAFSFEGDELAQFDAGIIPSKIILTTKTQ